ncbi:hypothetical protein B0T10DRAFT_466126 [Thelonectria olida]|uniref:Uncharacterized protein n=1 Tax=Thelonectria olida TaxID=1576542 RepID=A0A9P8VQJ1_9HYPO|nr:hypothetical protein B0T10DRAFT_466126 [Thelonectria olida]
MDVPSHDTSFPPCGLVPRIPGVYQRVPEQPPCTVACGLHSPSRPDPVWACAALHPRQPQMAETARALDRSNPPVDPTDWSEPAFGPIMVLFVRTWTASILWQYIVPWFIGALTNSPARLSHYMGVQRGFFAAGEAICIGIDSIKISYVVFASAIFGFYAAGVAVLACLGAYHIIETNYMSKIAGKGVESSGTSDPGRAAFGQEQRGKGTSLDGKIKCYRITQNGEARLGSSGLSEIVRDRESRRTR